MLAETGPKKNSFARSGQRPSIMSLTVSSQVIWEAHKNGDYKHSQKLTEVC